LDYLEEQCPVQFQGLLQGLLQGLFLGAATPQPLLQMVK
jgi:hypothetical protein